MANPKNMAEALAQRGHPNTIYWVSAARPDGTNGKVGHGVLKPDEHGTLGRYLTGPSQGTMVGEAFVPDIIQEYLKTDPLGLGPDYVLTKEDKDDLRYIDIGGVPAYIWLKGEAAKLGIDGHGDQPDTKPDEPAPGEKRARVALETIGAFVARIEKPTASAGGGKWARELRRLLPFLEEQVKAGLALVLLLLVASSLGCTSFRAVRHPADANFTATVSSDQPVPLLATLAGATDPKIKTILDLLQQFSGAVDPVGVALIVSVEGDDIPRFIRCAGDFEARCKGFRLHQVLRISGRLQGIFWEPTAIRE